MNNKDNVVSCVNYNVRNEWEPWTLGSRCPSCGSDEIEYNTQLVLTSNPPQSQLRCKHCGRYFSSGIVSRPVSQDDMVDTEYLKKLFKHDQSILHTPYIGDPLPHETPYIGDYPGWMDNGPGDKPPYTIPMPHYPPEPINYGWICPKCGRVLAPHVNSCPHCSAPTTINITY